MNLWKSFRRWRDKKLSGADRSRFFNIAHGRWFVQYPDGQKSEPMCWDVANEYAALFGGTVYHEEFDEAPTTEGEEHGRQERDCMD